MQLFLDTKTRLFYLFKILVTMTTISTPKNPQNDRVYTTATSKKRNIAAGWLLRTRTTFTKFVMVSVGVSKLGRTNLIFVDPGVKINAAYYRDVLLKQECCPISVQFLATSSFFSRTMHRPIGPVRRSRYCERFRLSLLPICGFPTAPTSTLLTTRCGVRCRTVFIGRRCETLTI